MSFLSSAARLSPAAARTWARPAAAASVSSARNMSDDAGSIREAGGAFGKKEKAVEEQYFRKLQSKQLENLKSHLSEEIAHHEEEIKRHQEAIKRHQEKVKKLDKAQK